MLLHNVTLAGSQAFCHAGGSTLYLQRCPGQGLRMLTLTSFILRSLSDAWFHLLMPINTAC